MKAKSPMPSSKDSSQKGNKYLAARDKMPEWYKTAPKGKTKGETIKSPVGTLEWNGERWCAEGHNKFMEDFAKMGPLEY